MTTIKKIQNGRQHNGCLLLKMTPNNGANIFKIIYFNSMFNIFTCFLVIIVIIVLLFLFILIIIYYYYYCVFLISLHTVFLCVLILYCMYSH